ncbi:MAG: hypothetical protein JRJ84_03810 [Deltaproteobacteria bacterium]|nr:hypothetical protein [Deltaproteobacteria bacterium]
MVWTWRTLVYLKHLWVTLLGLLNLLLAWLFPGFVPLELPGLLLEPVAMEVEVLEEDPVAWGTEGEEADEDLDAADMEDAEALFREIQRAEREAEALAAREAVLESTLVLAILGSADTDWGSADSLIMSREVFGIAGTLDSVEGGSGGLGIRFARIGAGYGSGLGSGGGGSAEGIGGLGTKGLVGRPTVRVASAEAWSDPAALRRHLQRAANTWSGCTGDERATATVNLKVSTAGKVVSAEVTGVPRDRAQCMATRAHGFQLPAPEREGATASFAVTL